MTPLKKDQLEKKIWHLFDKNPLLTAKGICKLLGLNHKKKGHHVTNEKYLWKKSYKNSLGLKGLPGTNFKNWNGWVYVDSLLDRKNDPDVTERAIAAGWIQTKARNCYLLWKDAKRGRLEWFLTGRIKIWIKKPADRGKVNELLVNAFVKTRLIFDYELFTAFLNAVRFKGATLLIPTSIRLPYLKLDFLKDSNGLIFKMGDTTHPHCLEFNFFQPNWGEKAEAAIFRLNKTLENLGKIMSPKPRDQENDHRMVI